MKARREINKQELAPEACSLPSWAACCCCCAAGSPAPHAHRCTGLLTWYLQEPAARWPGPRALRCAGPREPLRPASAGSCSARTPPPLEAAAAVPNHLLHRRTAHRSPGQAHALPLAAAAPLTARQAKHARCSLLESHAILILPFFFYGDHIMALQ